MTLFQKYHVPYSLQISPFLINFAKFSHFLCFLINKWVIFWDKLDFDLLWDKISAYCCCHFLFIHINKKFILHFLVFCGVKIRNFFTIIFWFDSKEFEQKEAYRIKLYHPFKHHTVPNDQLWIKCSKKHSSFSFPDLLLILLKFTQVELGFFLFFTLRNLLILLWLAFPEVNLNVQMLHFSPF